MPQAIHEADVDYEAQIQEIKRLVSTTSDPERRATLEEQLRELELASVQVEHNNVYASFAKDPASQRRKSFRPASAKPRTMLSALSEDHEVHLTSTSFHNLDAYRQENGPSLIGDVSSSSFDALYPATSILTNDQCTFWLSSGMFPQFLRLVLREPMPIAAVEITCRHVKKLTIWSSRGGRTNSSIGSSDTPNGSTAIEFVVPVSDGDRQSTHCIALSSAGDAEIVEVVIESGYSEFVCVYFVRLRLADPPPVVAVSSTTGGVNSSDDDEEDDEAKTKL